MVCGHSPRCRRLCRPRPFLLALLVAVCLFCQTLTPLMTNSFLSAVVNGISPNKQSKTRQGRYKEISARDTHCFFPISDSHTLKKIEDTVLQYFGSRTRRAILYAPPAHSKTERQLYQHILEKHGYAVTVLENGRLVEDLRHEGPYHNLQLSIATPECSSWHGLSRNSTTSNITHGDKSNVKMHITHLQYLWSQTDGAQLNQVLASSDHKDILKAQDLSVIIKAYVLVTSLTPLRAFLHSAATVWHPPKKKHFSVKLQRFFEMFFKSSSPQQAFNNMKEAISKLLLITEVLSESSATGPGSFNQCSQCFQMLTFDIGFSTSIHPVVLQVHKNFDFQDEEESNLQDQTFKEAIFEDTFKFLLSNKSSSSSFIEALQNIHGSIVSKDGIFHKEGGQCLSLEEINSVITFIKEVKNLGQFELLYPSAAPKFQTLLHDLYHMVDPMRRLGSVLTIHWLLSSLLEQFQFMTKETHSDLSEWRRKKSSRKSSPTAMKWLQPRNSSQENVIPKQNFRFHLWKNHQALPYSSKTKETQCSYDKDTLSHIRQIFTSPQLDLNPQFNPKIKEYYAEVPFDVVTVKIGAEPSNCQCQVHLDEVKGPSTANYPLGLGLNKIVVLVTDDSQPSPQIVSSYKIRIYREDRPSLPLFDDFMICGFVQVLFLFSFITQSNSGFFWFLCRVSYLVRLESGL
ncbi:cadherin-like and PC-esterase domain-containing protein 1 isoform X2 [Coturnix japonica]|uniref:cadherin-like and PC-esterase domain-containing protein 1 isoform X2 n=1 Tax=Coturnix japonica TaxID=93934 RepID=UPI000777B3DC|nr:cadherin-like and PC-esterase domain-containing protein 1 isoform X2 [Coturnix japonica]